MRTDRYSIPIALVLTVLFLVVPSADSQVYRYQDENGVWHYTDSPPAEEGVEAEQISSGVSPQAEPVGRDLQKQLLEKVPPKNKIEEARNATVSIQTALGSGSGFFISENGYVVTCKHVISGAGFDLEQTEREVETAGQNLHKYKDMLEQAESWLEIEQIWLVNAKKELE